MEEIKLNDELTIYRGREEEIDFFEMFFVFSKHNTQKYFLEGNKALDKIEKNFINDYKNKSFANYNKFERVIKKDMFSSFLNREDVKQNLKRVFIKDSNKNYVSAKDDERDTIRELFVYKKKFLLSIEGVFKNNNGTLIPYCSFYASMSKFYIDYLPYQRGITENLFNKEIIEVLPLIYQKIAQLKNAPTYIFKEDDFSLHSIKNNNVMEYDLLNNLEKEVDNECINLCKRKIASNVYLSESSLIIYGKKITNEGISKEDYDKIVNNNLFDLGDTKTKDKGIVL